MTTLKTHHCHQVRTDPNTKLATTAKQFQLQKGTSSGIGHGTSCDSILINTY